MRPFDKVKVATQIFTEEATHNVLPTDKIIQFNEGVIKQELKELVRTSAAETINGLPEEEAKARPRAEKCGRSQDRHGYHARHCERALQTTFGKVKIICQS